jgi:acetyl esterase/lipase
MDGMITTAIVAWCTLLALAPPRRPFALGAASFLCSFALNELPFVTFGYLLASTWLGLDQNDSDSPVTWAIISMAVLTAAGLALVAWRGLRAAPALSRALTEGLGAGWRTTLDEEMAARLRRRIPLARVVFAPIFYHRRDVRRVANISYGDAGRQNLLDVYQPRSAQPSGAPVLVHLHGGALFMGKKNREALPLLYRLASQGWVCISANYRLRPAARFPDYLVDVKKVIAWAREHAHEYGADPAAVFIAGSSSGGQLAALAALTPNDPAYQPGFEDADTSVTGAICLHAYYGQAGDQAYDSPLAYDTRHAPPFFLAHGDQDSLIPVEAARLFAANLRATSFNPVVYAELPGAQHGFDRFHSLRFERVVDAIEAFTAWIRSREQACRQ